MRVISSPEVDSLLLPSANAIVASDAGYFISRGRGTHPDRVISVFDFIFVRTGQLRIQEHNRTFSVSENETLLLWPGRRHFGAAPYSPDLSFYWCHFFCADPEVFTGSAMPPDESVVVPQWGRAVRPTVMEAYFDRYLQDQEAGLLTTVSRRCLLLLILNESVDHHQLSETPLVPSGAGAALAVHAEAYIRTHFHQPLTTSMLAAQLGYSPEYLSRAFQKTYGYTLTDAIHRHRLQAARLHLLSSDHSIEEIARLTGFNDVGHFRRLFRRHMGTTPGQFRRRSAQAYINTE